MLWDNQPSWGIVPFEALEPKMKVLTVDGQSSIQNDFDVDTYPLKAQFALRVLDREPARLSLAIPNTNREPSRLTTIILTGVTALVRSTAYTMETKGVTYPARDIRDFMREEYGFEIEWGTECVDVSQDDDGVTATLVHGRDASTRELVRCQYLVACDGINSRVRETLSLSQQESDYSGTVLQNMDVFLNDFPDADDYVHYCAGTDHFIMIVQLPGGYFRLLLSDRGEAADPNITPEQGFMRLVDQHFDGVTLGDLVWHSKWESWVRLADTYREGNVLLAGDSAHVHSTTGGQGMNCCMQDAFNLGWKLALVVQGRAHPELLNSYEAERRPIAEQVIWAASSLHEIFMGHGKDIAERAKKISDKEFLDAVIGRCSGIAYTYRDYVEQPDSSADIAGPMIGDRVPDLDLASGRTIFGLTRHTGFTLLALPGSRSEKHKQLAVLDSFRSRYGDLLHCHLIDASPALARSFGTSDEDRLLLIRPDGYVGYRCRRSDADHLEAHVEGILVTH